MKLKKKVWKFRIFFVYLLCINKKNTQKLFRQMKTLFAHNIQFAEQWQFAEQNNFAFAADDNVFFRHV